jgi:hypothetical protein
MLTCITVYLPKKDFLDPIRNVFSSQFDEIALYSGEQDQLIKKYPAFNGLIREAVRVNIAPDPQ